ncbi:unnamed protein product [Prunus armeniaca]
MERAAGSVVHPPYFDGYNYGAWKAKMKSFLWSLGERLWNTVVHGFFEPTKITGKGDEDRTLLNPERNGQMQKSHTVPITKRGCDTSKEAWEKEPT